MLLHYKRTKWAPCYHLRLRQQCKENTVWEGVQSSCLKCYHPMFQQTQFTATKLGCGSSNKPIVNCFLPWYAQGVSPTSMEPSPQKRTSRFVAANPMLAPSNPLAIAIAMDSLVMEPYPSLYAAANLYLPIPLTLRIGDQKARFLGGEDVSIPKVSWCMCRVRTLLVTRIHHED